MASASARHILVSNQETCENIKRQLDAGADFAACARQHSLCPSGMQGGDLGEFSPGEVVSEFEEVFFSGEISKVLGPVQTRFGYHLIEITSRRE